MLGLLVGDAHHELDRRVGPAHGTCLAQLACFTLEGVIRASVRFNHKGVCNPPSVVWHAWCRWAYLQGLGLEFAEHWDIGGSTAWPDGWLSQVRPLAQRRGQAPATVAALRRSPEVPERAAGSSAGHLALTRALPVAIFAANLDDAPGLAADLTRLTHGHLYAASATSAAVNLAGELIHHGRREVGSPRPAPDEAPSTEVAPCAYDSLASLWGLTAPGSPRGQRRLRCSLRQPPPRCGGDGLASHGSGVAQVRALGRYLGPRAPVPSSAGSRDRYLRQGGRRRHRSCRLRSRQ